MYQYFGIGNGRRSEPVLCQCIGALSFPMAVLFPSHSLSVRAAVVLLFLFLSLAFSLSLVLTPPLLQSDLVRLEEQMQNLWFF